MLQTTSLLLLVITILWIVYHFFKTIAKHHTDGKVFLANYYQNLISQFKDQNQKWNVRLNVWLLAVVCVTFLLLFLTGFAPILLFEQTLAGYPLLFHVTIALIFAFGFTIFTLSSAPAHSCGNKNSQDKTTIVRNVCYWLTVLLAVPLIGSITLGMFPLFGTDSQHLLLQIHQYSALFFSIAFILQMYLSAIQHIKKTELTQGN